MSLPRAYEGPHEPGALGGVEPFAKGHKLKTPDAQRILQSVLSYTLHKPRRTRFPTTATLVLDRDEQWQMDLVDIQKLSRWNKDHKYLLTVIDVQSKYAWIVPIKSKSSKEMIRGLRLNKKHRPFKKGYLSGWTEEVFVVTHVRLHPVVTYRISEWNGTPKKGAFYESDVQKVQVSDDSLFRVEKVFKRKGRNVLLRWKGWPSKYDSWIPPQPRQVRRKQKQPVKKGCGGWTKYRPKPADRVQVTLHPSWMKRV